MLLESLQIPARHDDKEQAFREPGKDATPSAATSHSAFRRRHQAVLEGKILREVLKYWVSLVSSSQTPQVSLG